MPRARPATRGDKRALLAWLGLLLIAGSLVWFQLLPARGPGVVGVPSPARKTFGLVVLDPGHGGNDSGTTSGGVLEKDLTLDLAQRVRRLLHEQGFATAMTRDSDEFVSLADRANFANEQEQCIFVSLHFNEGKRETATGVETYYAMDQPGAGGLSSWLPFLRSTAAPETNRQSQVLADCIQAAVVTRTQATNRGIKPEQFYVITNVRHPAVLVEGGFLTNKDDTARLEMPDYREKLAAAICAGIRHYRDAAQA
jgi:N-acetylmuramoyl-L-alanine amidase